jgi:hypothetical protein
MSAIFETRSDRQYSGARLRVEIATQLLANETIGGPDAALTLPRLIFRGWIPVTVPDATAGGGNDAKTEPEAKPRVKSQIAADAASGEQIASPSARSDVIAASAGGCHRQPELA